METKSKNEQNLIEKKKNKRKLYIKEWRKNNPDKIKKYSKSEKRKQYNKEYDKKRTFTEEQKEIKRSYLLEWRKNNPEKVISKII